MKQIFQFNGSEIQIHGLDPEVIELFRQSLGNSGEASRLLNIIDDPEFFVSFEVDGRLLENDSKPSERLKAAKIASFEFQSKDADQVNMVGQLMVGENRISIEVPNAYRRLLSLKNFNISFDIDFYSLKGLSKKSAPSLFISPTTGNLRPLVYINNTLFEDESIYDIEINATKDSSHIFRQQIGRIKIFLNAPGIITFNSDRTKIIDSRNYVDILNLANFISSETQRTIREVESSKNTPKKAMDKPTISSQSDVQNGAPSSNKAKDTPVKEKGDSFAELKQSTFDVGAMYSFDNLVTFKDAKGGKGIKPGELHIEPNDVNIGYKNQKFVFIAAGEYTVSFSFTDKGTGIEKLFKQSVEAVMVSKNITSAPEALLHTYVGDPSHLGTKIANFCDELNKMYRSGEYPISFSACVRTLVELVTSEINDTIGNEPAKNLATAYKNIMKTEVVNSELLSKISNVRFQEGVESIYKRVLETDKSETLIQFLNLGTHAANTFIDVSEIVKRIIGVQFLLTYLVIIIDKKEEQCGLNP